MNNAGKPAADPLDALQSALGYSFADRALLRQALRHSSAGAPHSERLEFLGDAVLGLVMARALYETHPHGTEGELTRWRSSLVRGQTLAEVARELSIGQYLTLGSGELKSGARDRDGVLADALEALIGATLVDGGQAESEALVTRLFSARVAAVTAAPPDKDPKTRLQEWLQRRALPLPRYEIVSRTGSDHAMRFTVSCRVAALPEPVVAEGTSRRGAEQAAASSVLQAINDQQH